MTDFRDVLDASSFQQGFVDSQGDIRTIELRYTSSGNVRILGQLQISPRLQGTTAFENFMVALVDHARNERIKLAPRAEPVVDWFTENPIYHDVLLTVNARLTSNDQSAPVEDVRATG